MHRFRLIIYLLFGISLLGAFSCQKEPVYPQIEFTENPVFALAYQDTLTFRFNVTDYSHGISIEVLDGDRVLPFSISKVSERNGSFVYMLYCNDRYVESGSYDLKVSAENDDVGSSSFANIRFTGLEKQITGIAYLQTDGVVKQYNQADGSTETVASAASYERMSFNSDYQKLFLIKSPLELDVLSLLDPFGIQTRPLATSPNLGYFDLHTSDRSTFVLLRENLFEEIGASANRIKSYTLPANLYANDISISGNTIFSLCSDQNNATSNTNLIRINLNAGQITDQTPLFGAPLAVKAINESDALILLNKDGLRQVFYFREADMSVTKVFETSLNLFRLYAFSQGQAFVYGQDGFYSFNPDFSLNPSLVSNIPISQLEYDELRQQFLVVSGNTLQWLNPSNGNAQLLLQNSTTIKAYSILYNK
jgi:hypothetical protein